MKHFFICDSYQAFFMALSIKDAKENITILTSQDDIKKTCELLELSYLTITKFNNSVSINSLKSLRKEVNDICSLMKGGVLHFSHTQYDVTCFLLVDSFKGKGGIVRFYNFELIIVSEGKFLMTVNFFKYLIIKNILNIVFNTHITLKIICQKPLFAITDKYIENNNISIIENEKDFHLLVYETSKNNQIVLKPLKNLYLEQNLAGTKEIDNASLEALYDNLINYDLVVKHHPYYPQDKKFINLKSIPSFLPAELILGNVTNTVISINSLTLVTAAKYDNIKTISLLNFVKFYNVDFINQIKELLVRQSFNRILFPNSFDELELLLK